MTTENVRPFSIWTRGYERTLGDEVGVNLDGLVNGKKCGVENIVEREVPVFLTNPRQTNIFCPPKWRREDVERALEVNRDMPGYCSMLVENSQEIERHIDNVYRTMYFHYIRGKRENIKKRFPVHCCGASATNIGLSLMQRGYANVVELLDYPNDHCYLGFPFIVQKTGERGFIIADPTSDQLWDDREVVPPRNHIFIVRGNHWNYVTDWKGGSNLFPTMFLNLDKIRKNVVESDCHWYPMSEDIGEYFSKVFENPVKLKV